AYDVNGRLVKIVHFNLVGLVLEQFSYALDVNGKCVAVTNLAGDVTHYTYDLAGRLARADYPGGGFEAFSYDAAGNRASVSTPAGSAGYGVNSVHEYQSVGGAQLQHDADGNLTNDAV